MEVPAAFAALASTRGWGGARLIMKFFLRQKQAKDNSRGRKSKKLKNRHCHYHKANIMKLTQYLQFL